MKAGRGVVREASEREASEEGDDGEDRPGGFPAGAGAEFADLHGVTVSGVGLCSGALR